MTEQFAQRNAEVFGVSMDSKHTNRAYAASMGGLTYPLLSDWKPHGALTRALGIEVPEADYIHLASLDSCAEYLTPKFNALGK